jgi:hypothetical protein
MTSILGRQRFLRNGLFYSSLTIIILLFSSLFIPLVNKWLDGELNAFGTIILFPLILFALITSLATIEVIPWREMTWLHLRQPRILGAIGSISLMAVGAVTGLLPLLEKKGGPEKAIKELSTGLGEINTILATIGKDVKDTKAASEEARDTLDKMAGKVGAPSQIEQHIGGIWGQEGCANTYSFTLDERGSSPRILSIKSVVNDTGVTPMKWTFIVGQDSLMISNDGFKRSMLRAEEEQGWHPGSTVEFTYIISSVERLRWESKHTNENGIRDQSILILTRCPEKGTQ